MPQRQRQPNDDAVVADLAFGNNPTPAGGASRIYSVRGEGEHHREREPDQPRGTEHKSWRVKKKTNKFSCCRWNSVT